MRKEMQEDKHLVRAGWDAGPGLMQRPGEAGDGQGAESRVGGQASRQRDGRAVLPDARVRASETERQSESDPVVEAARHYKRPETWRTWAVHSYDAALISGGSLRARLMHPDVVAGGRLRVPDGYGCSGRAGCRPGLTDHGERGKRPVRAGLAVASTGEARCPLMRTGRGGVRVVVGAGERPAHGEGGQQGRGVRSRSGGRA